MTTHTKPTDKHGRVLRGGSWFNTTATIVRAAFRLDGRPTYRNSSFGFRLTQSGCRQQVLKVNP